MNSAASWLERQYWADVIAVLPDDLVERRIALSQQVRERHPAHLDLAYGEHQRHRLDVFLPEGPGPWPLFVYVHGGYWKRGSKDDCAFLAPAWLERGAAVAIPSYRFLPEVDLADIAGDIRDAFSLLVDSADALQIDLSRVVVSGLSAGAHLVAMEMTSSNLLQPAAAGLLSGVYNPRPLQETSVGPFLTDSLPLSFDEISPLGRRPPATTFVVAWGEEETKVFKQQSRSMAAVLASWGTDVSTFEIAGANHFTILDCLQADHRGPLAQTFAEHLFRE